MIRKNGPIPDVFTANKNLQSSENSFSNHEKDIEENKKIFTSLHQYAATECLPHMVHSAEKIQIQKKFRIILQVIFWQHL